MQCIIMEKHSNQSNKQDETKKRAHNSQKVRAKENLNKSNVEPPDMCAMTMFILTHMDAS